MKKDIDSEKITKYVGVGVVTASLAMSLSVGIYEASVDHNNEYCMLNNIYGLEHQADKINDSNSRYEAVYIPKNESEINADSVYYDQHVIEYVKYYFNDYVSLENDNIYAVVNGVLDDNVIPYGEERVELYDHNSISDEPQLIRIFK